LAHCFRALAGVEKGEAAVKSIKDAHPGAALELLQLDVSDDESVTAAATSLARGQPLYALVNNAGVGLQTDGGGSDTLLQTNFYGPRRVSEAFVSAIAPGGRIVNVSSGSASMWLREQSADTKALFSNPDVTWPELEAAVQEAAPAASMGGYGLSKAGLTAYTMIQAKMWPSLTCTSLSPGFIETNMTRGWGARLTPEQGTVSLLKCLFGEVTSGWYYGSDGLRSPLTVTRDPGTPEYEGEPDPDASKYNN
jgi:NAD(P)-dependent dehydrogenase (short-subunit alcohol dehydrogenase family)